MKKSRAEKPLIHKGQQTFFLFYMKKVLHIRNILCIFRVSPRATSTTQTTMTLPDIKPYTSILVVEAERQAKVAALKQRVIDMIEAEKAAADQLRAAINASKP